MNGTDGADAAHREPYRSCGLSTSCKPAAARSSILLPEARICDRCLSDVTFAAAADASHRDQIRVAPALVLTTPSALKTAGS
jgi:hypothetical protein